MAEGRVRVALPLAAALSRQGWAREAHGQTGNRLEECLHFCQDASMNVTALVETDAAEEGRKAV